MLSSGDAAYAPIPVARLADKSAELSGRNPLLQTEAQVVEAVAIIQPGGLPLEESDFYIVSNFPDGSKVDRGTVDAGRWRPSKQALLQAEHLLFVQDTSNIFLNGLRWVGLVNPRPWQLRFKVNDEGEVYAVDKRSHGQNGPRSEELIGRVQQEFETYFVRGAKCCCGGSFDHFIQRVVNDSDGNLTLSTKFVISVDQSCCREACCTNNVLLVVHEKNGQEVGCVRKMFGNIDDDCCEGCCRCEDIPETYLLEFPPATTNPEDRMLILTSIIQLDSRLLGY